MKMKPIICAITLICMFVSSPMAVAIDRDTIRSKAQSALKATQGKVASAGTSAWQTMSKSAVVEKANRMLKTLKEDMKCLSRWDCTPAQRKRIMKEVSALMALVVILLVGGYLWKRNTQAEGKTVADRLGTSIERPLTFEEALREEELRKLIITTPGPTPEETKQQEVDTIEKIAKDAIHFLPQEIQTHLDSLSPKEKVVAMEKYTKNVEKARQNAIKRIEEKKREQEQEMEILLGLARTEEAKEKLRALYKKKGSLLHLDAWKPKK